MDLCEFIVLLPLLYIFEIFKNKNVFLFFFKEREKKEGSWMPIWILMPLEYKPTGKLWFRIENRDGNWKWAIKIHLAFGICN